MQPSPQRPNTSLLAPMETMGDHANDIAQVHRAVTTDGREVAVKVLRPNIEEDFAAAIDTYEWAAAQVEAMGGEPARAYVPHFDPIGIARRRVPLG